MVVMDSWHHPQTSHGHLGFLTKEEEKSSSLLHAWANKRHNYLSLLINIIPFHTYKQNSFNFGIICQSTHQQPILCTTQRAAFIRPLKPIQLIEILICGVFHPSPSCSQHDLPSTEEPAFGELKDCSGREDIGLFACCGCLGGPLEATQRICTFPLAKYFTAPSWSTTTTLCPKNLLATPSSPLNKKISRLRQFCITA